MCGQCLETWFRMRHWQRRAPQNLHVRRHRRLTWTVLLLRWMLSTRLTTTTSARRGRRRHRLAKTTEVWSTTVAVRRPTGSWAATVTSRPPPATLVSSDDDWWTLRRTMEWRSPSTMYGEDVLAPLTNPLNRNELVLSRVRCRLGWEWGRKRVSDAEMLEMLWLHTGDYHSTN